MICTIEKCWPGALGAQCCGNLQLLSQFSSDPTRYLQQSSSFSKLYENPEFTWQVWLSKLTASEFTSDEISSFTVCESHQQIFQKIFSDKNASAKCSCSICGRKRNVRRVSYQMHKACFSVFKIVVPIAASICQDCRSAIKPDEEANVAASAVATANITQIENDTVYVYCAFLFLYFTFLII